MILLTTRFQASPDPVSGQVALRDSPGRNSRKRSQTASVLAHPSQRIGRPGRCHDWITHYSLPLDHAGPPVGPSASWWRNAELLRLRLDFGNVLRHGLKNRQCWVS